VTLTLVIDTALNACTAALFDRDRMMAETVEPMARGHQERLGGMVADLFDVAGVAPRVVGRIGVTLGPGSFTGLRVGLSFAKGLATGLGIKAYGIGTLEALGHHPAVLGERRMSVIDGGRGQIYAQVFGMHWEGGDGEGGPIALSADSDFASFRDIEVLTGPGAALLVNALPRARLFNQDWPTPAAINALAQTPGHADLTPIYMRDADAKVSTRGVIALSGGALTT
jgi:tRNA threonylcarbamoyladenosine biosynthesis protein TsaB